MKTKAAMMMTILMAMTSLAFAGELKLAPGQWETTIQVEKDETKQRAKPRVELPQELREKIASKIQPFAQTICLSEKDAANLQKVLPETSRRLDDCVIKDWKMDGDKATWSVWCRSTKGTAGKGEAVFQTDSYEGKIVTKTRDETTTMLIEGKRNGECEP